MNYVMLIVWALSALTYMAKSKTCSSLDVMCIRVQYVSKHQSNAFIVKTIDVCKSKVVVAVFPHVINTAHSQQ